MTRPKRMAARVHSSTMIDESTQLRRTRVVCGAVPQPAPSGRIRRANSYRQSKIIHNRREIYSTTLAAKPDSKARSMPAVPTGLPLPALMTSFRCLRVTEFRRGPRHASTHAPDGPRGSIPDDVWDQRRGRRRARHRQRPAVSRHLQRSGRHSLPALRVPTDRARCRSIKKSLVHGPMKRH